MCIVCNIWMPEPLPPEWLQCIGCGVQFRTLFTFNHYHNCNPIRIALDDAQARLDKLNKLDSK